MRIDLKNIFFYIKNLNKNLVALSTKSIDGVRIPIPQDTYSPCADRAKIMPIA